MILAAVGTTVATDFDYRPAASLPVTGTLAPDASEVYSRLPDSLKGKVRDELWALGLNSGRAFPQRLSGAGRALSFSQ